jgi:hypothetical protein
MDIVPFRDSALELGKEIALSVESLRLPAALINLLSTDEAICAREGQCWDFKREQISNDILPLAETCRDIAAFFNAYGGFIILGVEEVEKDLRFRVAGLSDNPFPMQRLKGLLGKYLSAIPDISYEEYNIDCSGRSVKIAAIAIPKRPAKQLPAKFLTRGPEKKNKVIFDSDQLAVRRGDQSRIVASLEDWELVSSERRLDSSELEIGRYATVSKSLAIDHNLPMRSVICRRFIGRKVYLTSLWEWLNDDFQYCRVIAGDGGKGKTSLAYELATQVAKVGPCGFTRIIWLTAKSRQFHAESNEWREMLETHFSDFRSLLMAVGENLGYMKEELEVMSDNQLNRSIRQQIDIQATLFVFDDLDSLSPDDQKRTMEFASQVGRSEVRFLLTTRSNASYSSDLCLKLRGLDKDDFYELVDLLSVRYGISLPKGVRDSIHEATDGSPLLLDSILRLVHRGSEPASAVKEWAGAAGEDARRAVLQKEIDLLSPEAKRVLLCIAFFAQCSNAEIQQVSNLAATKLEDCLRELESLFLVDSPKIIESQPRYEMNATSIALIISQKENLAFDHAKILRQVSAIRSPILKGGKKGNREKVGRAVSQAIALARSGDYDGATETVNAALKADKSNPDLLLLRARLRSNSGKGKIEDVRRDLRASHSGGCRKPLLFEIWLETERNAGFGPGMLEVCELAVSHSPSDRPLWAEKKAEGYVLNALVKAKSGDYSGAASELGIAADEVVYAINSGDASESAAEHLELLNDKVLSYVTKSGDGGLVVDAVRDAIRRGDLRTEIFHVAFDALRKLYLNGLVKSKSSKNWAASQCSFLANQFRSTNLTVAPGLAIRFESLAKNGR